MNVLGKTLVLLSAIGSLSAHAERPMNVDDASTLDKGGAKLEFGWSRDDRAKGLDGAAGFSPLENLEVEIGLARARDAAASPDETTHTYGLALKWVPWQHDTGWSAGLKYEYGRDRLEGVSTRTHALTGLLTWAFEGGAKLHINLGREFVRERGHSDHANTWGVGVDMPLTPRLDLIVESFGASHSGPERAVGVRYRIADGLKVSAAVGRGNERSFANAGIAWEF